MAPAMPPMTHDVVDMLRDGDTARTHHGPHTPTKSLWQAGRQAGRHWRGHASPSRVIRQQPPAHVHVLTCCACAHDVSSTTSAGQCNGTLQNIALRNILLQPLARRKP